jgi:hypothetical protein
MHHEAEKSEKTLLSQVAQENNGRNPREFVLLLKHRPDVERSSIGLFDLQLSGHTHKGQIFPFCGLTRLFYPNDGGFSQPGKGSLLYVSRGSGTWGPPIRFLAPPEITIIELVHAEEKPAVGATQVASVSQ